MRFFVPKPLGVFLLEGDVHRQINDETSYLDCRHTIWLFTTIVFASRAVQGRNEMHVGVDASFARHLANGMERFSLKFQRHCGDYICMGLEVLLNLEALM